MPSFIVLGVACAQFDNSVWLLQMDGVFNVLSYQTVIHITFIE